MLDQNIRILQVHTDDEELQAKRLITSAMIVSLAVIHQLTFFGDNELKNLLECLLIHGDPGTYKCSGLDLLIRHFPEQHLR